MRTIKAKAGGLANLYGSALAALLLLAVASLAAQPLPGKAYRNAVASLSPGMPAATGPALPTNRFEISLYTIESGESEKDSIQYTTQLFSALARRNGWASEVEPSNENILKTRKECVDKNAFCDVVGVTEDYAESRMTLTLTVLSVPQSHGDLHKARIDPGRKGAMVFD